VQISPEATLYQVIGAHVAVIVPLTFLTAWAYCALAYGFLFGFALGWIPAGILAGIAFGIAWFAWPVIAVALLIVGLDLLGI
jgi:hypothetical protein